MSYLAKPDGQPHLVAARLVSECVRRPVESFPRSDFVNGLAAA